MDYLKDNNLLDEKNLSEESKTHLFDIAKWANILAILSFVGLVIGVVSLFVKTGPAEAAGGAMAGATLAGGLFTYIFVIAITLLIYITLFNASKNIKLGLTQQSQGYFNIGVTKLATYFRILGILSIIGGVLVLLVLLIGVFAGIATNSFR